MGLVYPNCVYHDVEAFMNRLIQAGQGMQFNIPQPDYIKISDNRSQTYMQIIDQAIYNHSLQLVFCVVMNIKADKYAAIKKRSLVDRAVPTQVLVATNLNKKGVMSIATKVAIQIDCKISRAPWFVQMPLPYPKVIGVDVSNDCKSKGKSFGAMESCLLTNRCRGT